MHWTTKSIAKPGLMPLAIEVESNVCSSAMDRLHELENLRRSLAMLEPGSKALDRETAMRLIAELQDLERRMRSLREALTGVLADRNG
jgi:hypothetical protein